METIQQNEDVIRRIYELHGEYDPNSNLTALEQLEICEAVAESMYPYHPTTTDTPNNDNGNLKWNGNDSYKRRVYFELTESKQKVINELKACNYRTDRHRIEELLTLLFTSNDTALGHWLYIAQNWNPRAINRVIARMVKLQSTGAKSIKNPAGYFTYLLKFRKKRRGL